jgi:2-polyprenyl-3-methyl-5-hydroxy-6-metoxy-1,4-benzoquinol methylase
MESRDTREQAIIRSWYSNAAPWSRAIRTESIASRKLVTNQAIIDAVASVSPAHVSPSSVLDVGCGEGWLARALAEHGIRTTGIDVVPELIAQAAAQAASIDSKLRPEFLVQDYSAIAGRFWPGGPFDAAVCNFSLLGETSVESLLAALPFYLRSSGRLIVQTLHPAAACGNLPYEDGWRAGSWLGFSSDFRDPAPWYFRTMESWQAMLERCGFEILECREPKAAAAVTPASIIWIGSLR